MKFTWRIWLLIAVLLLSALAINPSLDKGVIVTSIEINSSVEDIGLAQGDVIVALNGKTIESVEDYSKIMEELFEDGLSKRIDILTESQEYSVFIDEAPEITIADLPKTNIQTGLDLRGGARALVQPDQIISDDDMDDLVSVARNRFNVYGLKDVNIRGVKDLEGQNFMLVEISGATPDELEQLISEQGEFKATIGNQTVFVGGEKDISDVCRNDATCAGVTSCQPDGAGAYFCNFAFTIYLTEETAKRHAQITEFYPLDASGQYLTENLFLYVDDNEVESLRISSGLRGQVTSQISIQGSGQGNTQESAFDNAKDEMNRLQTVLLTGSLPYQLEIVKLDTISPLLGDTFVNSILLAGVLAIVLVSIIVFVRYRNFKASLALLFTAFSELFIILGIAALIRWNLDLPSIAGILATIGTGVDQQIVILDEAGKGGQISMREKMKRALFVIGTAYATSVVSLVPLYWAGAGLFKGFAFTTIIGITAGVLITRPAFADMIKSIKGD
tara:strand:- start:114 stop:1622 length:1509 start_codon:yes stop_codon:yes gene_type:complete